MSDEYHPPLIVYTCVEPSAGFSHSASTSISITVCLAVVQDGIYRVACWSTLHVLAAFRCEVRLAMHTCFACSDSSGVTATSAPSARTLWQPLVPYFRFPDAGVDAPSTERCRRLKPKNIRQSFWSHGYMTALVVRDVSAIVWCRFVGSVVFVRHAGVEAGSERQAAVRFFGEVFGKGEGRRA